MTLTNAQEENLLKTMKGEAATTYAELFVKLHTGDPGEEGTANAAGETARKKITFSGTNPLKNAALAEWPGVSTTEEYSHVSLWSTVGPAGGTAVWTGALNEKKAVSAGDSFTLKKEEISGALD